MVKNTLGLVGLSKYKGEVLKKDSILSSEKCLKENIKGYRENTNNSITMKSPSEYYLSEDYEVYFVEYIGDAISKIKNINFANIFLTGKFFALLFVENGRLNEVLKLVPEITNIQKGFPYTLSELRISSNLYSSKTIDKENIMLQGEGVVVGIISTGIDYLNPRFIKANGNSRVLSVWDQSLDQGPVPNGFLVGTEFTEEIINEALRRRNMGENPYSIVNHKDMVGHGTAIAGIIGGAAIEPGDALVSVVPKCDFAVVKLKEAKSNTLRLSGIDRRDIPIYQDSDIAAAIRYLAELQEKLKRPMTVYLALGSNYGGRNGQTVLERYIDYFTQKRDFTVVSNTGSQGNAQGHASGIISRIGEERIIPINVDNSEGNLFFSIYIFKPDNISIGILAPTGERIQTLTIPQVNGEIITFNLGKSTIILQYFSDGYSNGDERIDVLIRNAVGGAWIINLLGEYIVKGKYDMWLIQKELLLQETRFLEADMNITLMTPATAINALTTSYYNQKNNTIVPESGRGFTREGIIKPSVATAGVDILTVGLNNQLIVATGAAMAGALLTGAIAMIYEWGIIRENDLELFPPKMRSYIISSAVRDEGQIYPNPEWGFGRLSFKKLHENLSQLSRRNVKDIDFKEKEKVQTINIDKLTKKSNSNVQGEDVDYKGVYIHIPVEIYERIGMDIKHI